MFGLDYVTGPPITTLKASGVTFVCRYLSYVNNLTQVKLLSASEAKALSDAGIAIVSNYEWYANRALEGISSGVQDAQIAASQHAACGGPADRPLYFSVDCDVDGSQVIDYFRGVASIIGLHRTGAYGSYRVIKYLFDNHLITWGWQTYAWSGGLWEPRAHIQQYQNGVDLAGHSVDYNRSMQTDFGQWLVGQKGIEPMLQLTDPMGKNFTATASNRWHCATTGFDIAYALLTFYRQCNGELDLPISGEIYLQDYPGTAIQYCRRGLMAYDPLNNGKRKIDNTVVGTGDSYLLRLDSGIGQQAIAKPLLSALQAQVDTLTKQVATMTDELTALKAQATPDTSALEQQISILTAQVEAYKQAVSQVEATIGALAK